MKCNITLNSKSSDVEYVPLAVAVNGTIYMR